MKKMMIVIVMMACMPVLALAINVSKVPFVVRAAFSRNFPQVHHARWNKEDGNYEANFRAGGKIMSATYDATGRWMETETDMPVKNLPSAARTYIASHCNGKRIKDASVIKRPKGVVLFEAGVMGKDYLFNKNGKFIKTQKD